MDPSPYSSDLKCEEEFHRTSPVIVTYAAKNSSAPHPSVSNSLSASPGPAQRNPHQSLPMTPVRKPSQFSWPASPSPFRSPPSIRGGLPPQTPPAHIRPLTERRLPFTPVGPTSPMVLAASPYPSSYSNAKMCWSEPAKAQATAKRCFSPLRKRVYDSPVKDGKQLKSFTARSRRRHRAQTFGENDMPSFVQKLDFTTSYGKGMASNRTRSNSVLTLEVTNQNLHSNLKRVVNNGGRTARSEEMEGTPNLFTSFIRVVPTTPPRTTLGRKVLKTSKARSAFTRKERAPIMISDKPCKCKRSMCLKLYCECFAAGKVCGPACKCCQCHNHLRNETARVLREEARAELLRKKPDAFESKVKQKGHRHGCHCKKSGCKKKYCECFAAGVPCSDLCRCQGCENIHVHDGLTTKGLLSHSTPAQEIIPLVPIIGQTIGYGLPSTHTHC